LETLFDLVSYRDVLRRVESLQPDARRQWGTMTVNQMMEHAARTLEIAAGKKPSHQAFLGKLIGWIFWRRFVGPTPFQKNGPSLPALVVQGEPEFSPTKDRLKTLLAEFHAVGEHGCDGNIHGFFGRMTGTEWGVTQYKHMDHHLRQFGA
jgi:Protein of unknown function (DUF1569)